MRTVSRRIRLTRAATERPFVVGLGALAMVSLVFLLAPRIDLAVSRLFYESESGFLHRRFAVLETIRGAGRLVEMLFAVAVVAPLPVKLLFPQRPLLLAPRATLFVLASFLLGPGLVVNGVLKAHWGRARPREIVEFGGEASYSPAWRMADQCAGNCSFVSGEAASAFWLVALVFVVPPRWRPATATAALAFATIVSFTRIAMGGHFLSDVLIAWLLTLLVMIVLRRAVLVALPAAFDVRIEQAITAAGGVIRRAVALRTGRRPL